MVQYFTYVEITTGEPHNLWVHYEQARAAKPNMALGRIRERTDIYPVLRELFAKKEKGRRLPSRGPRGDAGSCGAANAEAPAPWRPEATA
jgi:hypothetical protein